MGFAKVQLLQCRSAGTATYFPLTFKDAAISRGSTASHPSALAVASTSRITPSRYRSNKSLPACHSITVGGEPPTTRVSAAVFAMSGPWTAVSIHTRPPASILRRIDRIASLSLSVSFARGEEIRTEISSKFRRATVEAELAAAGLRLTHWWTDPDDDFALSLAVPV